MSEDAAWHTFIKLHVFMTANSITVGSGCSLQSVKDDVLWHQANSITTRTSLGRQTDSPDMLSLVVRQAHRSYQSAAPDNAAGTQNIPDMLSLVVGRVHASQGELTPLSPLHIPVQPEAENRVLDQTLLYHFVERWCGSCHCNLREPQTLHSPKQDATPLCCHY